MKLERRLEVERVGSRVPFRTGCPGKDWVRRWDLKTARKPGAQGPGEGGTRRRQSEVKAGLAALRVTRRLLWLEQGGWSGGAMTGLWVSLGNEKPLEGFAPRLGTCIYNLVKGANHKKV